MDDNYNLYTTLNHILQKFRIGRILTMARILDLSSSEAISLKHELDQEGINFSIEEDFITLLG